VHGLADDRLRIKIDGMDLIASCPNHMNPPLSYLDPRLARSRSTRESRRSAPAATASAAPSSRAPPRRCSRRRTAPGAEGAAQSAPTRAATARKGIHNLAATMATDTLSLNYSGAMAGGQHPRRQQAFKSVQRDRPRRPHCCRLDEVGSTAYDTRNHTLGAWRTAASTPGRARLGYQDVP
jgi:iron complex outermembrane receptor protein